MKVMQTATIRVEIDTDAWENFYSEPFPKSERKRRGEIASWAESVCQTLMDDMVDDLRKTERNPRNEQG